MFEKILGNIKRQKVIHPHGVFEQDNSDEEKHWRKGLNNLQIMGEVGAFERNEMKETKSNSKWHSYEHPSPYYTTVLKKGAKEWQYLAGKCTI